MEIQSVGHPSVSNISASRVKQLRDISVKLESSFLSEMLKSAGLGKQPDAFGGGEGEDQFSSFLRAAQADAIAEAGGVGLAESIFQSLKGKE